MKNREIRFAQQNPKKKGPPINPNLQSFVVNVPFPSGTANHWKKGKEKHLQSIGSRKSETSSSADNPNCSVGGKNYL